MFLLKSNEVLELVDKVSRELECGMVNQLKFLEAV